MQARDRRAGRLVQLVYIGFPLASLLVTAAIAWASCDHDLSLGAAALLAPALVLIAGLLLGRQQRYRTGAWPRAGQWFGGFTGLFISLQLILLEVPVLAFTFPVWVVLGALAGRLLGRQAQRVILEPAVVELAGGRYELLFALRGKHPVRLRIGPDQVAVQRKVPGSLGYGETKWQTGVENPIGAVESADQVVLTGDEQLATPMSGGGPAASPGPALAVRFTGPAEDWVLPLDQAEIVGRILLGRQSAG
jgi:hypothetical protein